MIPLHQQALTIAQTASLPDAPDRYVFFSNQRNRKAATGFCKKNPDFVTVLHTPAHKQLENLPLFGQDSSFSIEQAVDVSALLSARFAQNAAGNVMVFTDKVSDRSTFFTIELPILMMNDKVTTINGAPKETWAHYIKAPVLPRTDIVPASLLHFTMP